MEKNFAYNYDWKNELSVLNGTMVLFYRTLPYKKRILGRSVTKIFAVNKDTREKCLAAQNKNPK